MHFLALIAIGALIFVGMPILLGFIPLLFAQLGPLGFIFGCILGFVILAKLAGMV